MHVCASCPIMKKASGSENPGPSPPCHVTTIRSRISIVGLLYLYSRSLLTRLWTCHVTTAPWSIAAKCRALRGCRYLEGGGREERGRKLPDLLDPEFTFPRRFSSWRGPADTWKGDKSGIITMCTTRVARMPVPEGRKCFLTKTLT